MNAAVASGLLMMAAGLLFIGSGVSHASLITMAFGVGLLGMGGYAFGRWWGRGD